MSNNNEQEAESELELEETHFDIREWTIEQLASELALNKQKNRDMEARLDTLKFEREELRDNILVKEQSRLNVQKMTDLPKNLYYEQPDGMVLELRGADGRVKGETTFPPEVQSRATTIEASLQALDAEKRALIPARVAEIDDLISKLQHELADLEKQYAATVRSYSVWWYMHVEKAEKPAKRAKKAPRKST